MAAKTTGADGVRGLARRLGGRGPRTAGPGPKLGRLARLRRFFIEIWGELRKVIWPSWDEVGRFTGVVVLVVVGVALYLWIADQIFALMSSHFPQTPG